MINETIYMENRVLRMFCEKNKINPKQANSIFNTHNIWKYIEQGYDLFHLNSDEYVFNDICHILEKKGARI